MKLTDLDPWCYGYGGEGVSNADGSAIPEQIGVGIAFDCPCGKCGEKVSLGFKNPIDGSKQVNNDRASWQRKGNTFENLTLTPSIQRMGKCRWHGYLTDGEFKEC